MVSAGVAVRKSPEVCLTVAFHTWEVDYVQDPQSLGSKEGSFDVYQADTLTANVVSRAGSSGIELAKLVNGIKFDNTYQYDREDFVAVAGSQIQ